jgi:Rne/Rng family ribonuclease
MSKELVISAASHERRVAILEEGQLVEIYIEREKEFALVGSIYKGRVTRVLPGMQSAFVDIGLDGDAFLYVSDVFENLEDYDHGHGPAEALTPARLPAVAALSEVLPGESLAAHPQTHSSEDGVVQTPSEESAPAEAASTESASDRLEHPSAPPAIEAHLESISGPSDAQPDEPEERQPESNASAPQNFAPNYNPTQKYSPRSDRGERNDRGGQDYGGRGGDRGRGRWNRRGGRRRGGGRQGGRNLPPSKYASPQGERSHDSRGHDSRGHDSRGYEQRGQQSRSFENRRSEGPRYAQPSAPAGAQEDDILLPGESLAKYRNRPAPISSASAPMVEEERHIPDAQPEVSRPAASSGAPSGAAVPRRSSGGLPSWLLAETGAETEVSSTGTQELSDPAEDTSSSVSEPSPAHESSEAEQGRPDTSLTDEDAEVISTSLIEAKHEEIQAHAAADALVGGAVFDEGEDDGEEEEQEEEQEGEDSAESHEGTGVNDEAQVTQASSDDELDEEANAAEAHALAEAEADAAHEAALHAEATGAVPEARAAVDHETLEAHPGETTHASLEQESSLLPGETRAPRSGSESHEDFPRDSARIGGNPRARFQRPYRGGRDRGRDNRGGRSDRRGRGQRFERRPGHYRHHGGHSGPARRPQLISEMLKAGQDVVVQIAKEPLGKKGARITSHVALPGRFLVYMPTIDHIGVSRKIASADNRSRLRRLVSEARGSYPGGFIVRTAAGGASDEEIRTDIDFLGKTWNEIKERSDQRKAPALLHRDLNLVERILRDYVSDDFSAIWIDSEEEYGKVVEFVSRFQPKLVSRVKLYSKETPIFEEFGIQHELDKALRAKVWLKSGGYIVINHTEALVAIDVNTGKFVGKGSTRLEDTIVKTNLEAVKEIVRQIRLRDLGGIIVVDFIDMEERRNREKVLVALQQALEQDKAPSKALSFNEFGLVCITRKRTKQALERVLCQPCPYCTGSGMVKSIPTLCYEIQAEARKMATSDQETPNLTLRVHPEIAKALKTRESMLIDELEQTTHKHVIIQSDATLHWEQYDIC